MVGQGCGSGLLDLLASGRAVLGLAGPLLGRRCLAGAAAGDGVDRIGRPLVDVSIVHRKCARRCCTCSGDRVSPHVERPGAATSLLLRPLQNAVDIEQLVAGLQ